MNQAQMRKLKAHRRKQQSSGKFELFVMWAVFLIAVSCVFSFWIWLALNIKERL